MKKILLNLLCVCFLVSNLIAQNNQRPIGMNLDFIKNWNSQHMFVDLMRYSRMWIPRDSAFQNQFNHPGVPLFLRQQDGYPIKIPYVFNDTTLVVHTLLKSADPSYPGGIYNLIFEGTGVIQITDDGSGTFSTPNTLHPVNVTPTINGIDLTILQSDTLDPIRNIRFIMPGFENTYQIQPFHPKFLENLNGFDVIRFMTATKTNSVENISSWSQRTTINHFSQAVLTGIAYEYIPMLCNQLSIDPWINIPHKADDNFVTQFAQLLFDSLDANRKVYIEYSNEVWNPSFPQNQFCRDTGMALGLSIDTTLSDSIMAQRRYQTKRSVEVFEIFEQVFGGNQRLVKIIAGQRANPSTGSTLLKALSNPIINPNNITIDAYAVGAYIGGNLAEMFCPNASTVTVNEILDSLEAQITSNFIPLIQQNYDTASTYGLPLFAYEGGQSLRADSPNCQTNTTLTTILADANRDSRMKDINCQLFDAWYSITNNGFFNYFSYISKYAGGAGFFGALEFNNQDTSTAPKYQAIRDCIFNYNISGLKAVSLDNEINLYPNPFTTSATLQFANLNNTFLTLSIYNTQGLLVRRIENITSEQVIIERKNLNNGLYFFQLHSDTEVHATGKLIIE